MRFFNKKSFRLPFVGKDEFIRLTRMGLGYDRGSFYIKNYDNAEKIIDMLSEILDEQISFIQTCILCEKDFVCSECKYRNQCTTEGLPFQCICEICMKNEKLYDKYIENQTDVS